MHLLKTQQVEEVIEAKEVFEAYVDSFEVRIKHYHANNGIFKAKIWRTQLHLGLTFAGVNSHDHNGHAERRIRSLQDMA